MDEQLERTVELVRAWVDAAERIAVLTGAGISTDSGIPDFRGPQGVWTRNPEAEKTATLDHYLGDPEVRRRSWRNRLDSPIWDALPNDGHRALAELERRGKVIGVLTQNIDGLHQLAGSDPGLVVELHGNARSTVCWTCGDRLPMEEVLGRVRAGEDDPACMNTFEGDVVCGGILKSATISFGQKLDVDDLARAERIAATCDLMLAVGTTLTVYPAAGVVPVAANAGARVVIINGEPTAYDRMADAVLRGPISELVPAVTAPVDDLGHGSAAPGQ
ncbi:MAG TPA: Sir2 family NAD-dependent protein deacetylase [Acidimicrobiales bacterium]|nr:Sir2 family NAD-dependent protein deacetylase [Acidimicrobiales bacterium]